MGGRRQKTVFVLLGVSIGLVAFLMSSGRTKRAAQAQESSQKKEVITSVPEVVSCVKKIRVVKAEIKNAGTPGAVVSVEVENTADVGIIAIAMTSAKGREAYTVTIRSSFEAGREPSVRIKPHKTGILEMAVPMVYTGVPLKIEGAMYADGTEDGCDLTNLHLARDHDKAKRKDPPK